MPPLVDFVSFNVYLETRDTLAAYLARLQNLAGERPLLMAKIGLDSRRNGEGRQTPAWQPRASRPDASAPSSSRMAPRRPPYRGLDFGLTTRDRQPKVALAAVAQAYREVPFPRSQRWPRISVIVCSYNGARTLGETLSALERLDYPDYEAIAIPYPEPRPVERQQSA
jgi:O-antigen biosynthesis protein